MVIIETVKRLSASPNPKNLYFYRTLKGVEVDLVIESGGKVDAYEFKRTQSPNKSMTISLQILKENHSVQKLKILAPINNPTPISKGILAKPCYSHLF